MAAPPLRQLVVVVLLLLCSLAAALSTTAALQLHQEDLSFLRSVHSSLSDLPGSTFFSTWEFSADACSFEGVLCSTPSADPFLRVTTLVLGSGDFDSPGLTGTLPTSLSSLPSLQQLIVWPGNVSGPLPISFPSSLAFLSVTGNLVSGPIPFSLAALPELHTLDLSHNRLSGPIPPPLVSLPNLKVLVLAGNGYLDGELPNVTSPLLHLDIQSNSFSGALPTELPTALRYLSASTNFLSGTLDPVAALPNLAFLDLSRNSLSGHIPPSLFSPSVPLLLLQRNNLTGTMPRAATPGSSSPGCWTVDLSHNRLTGAVTAALADAEAVYLNNNRFFGAVPAEYARSVYAGTMRTFYAQHNFLTGFDFPLPAGGALPESVAVCLAYNCMPAPPVGPTLCPTGAGEVAARPRWQCAVFGTAEEQVEGAEN